MPHLRSKLSLRWVSTLSQLRLIRRKVKAVVESLLVGVLGIEGKGPPKAAAEASIFGIKFTINLS
jgi:hypothetical protein